MRAINRRTAILLSLLFGGTAVSTLSLLVAWFVLLVILPVAYIWLHHRHVISVPPAAVHAEDSARQLQAAQPFRLIENLPIGVYQSDLNGNLIFSNPAVARMLRYDTVEALMQHNVNTHYVDPTQRNTMVNDYLQRLGYLTHEYQLKRKDGAHIWVRDIAHAVMNEDNTIVYMEGILEDISLYKSVEAALDSTNELIRRAKQEWEASVDSLSELVCLLDDGKCIIRANRTLERWGMGSVRDAAGKHLATVLEEVFQFPDFPEQLDQNWRQLERGRKVRFEIEDLPSQRFFLVQLNPIALEAFHTETHDSSAGVVVISDVSLQKQLERDLKLLNAELENRVQERTAALEAANARLQTEFAERAQLAEELSIALAHEKQLNAFKSRFGTLISHEFRTPLTIIQTATDLMERYADQMPEEKRREIPNRIRKQIRHLVNMIDDIMTISKADTIGLESHPIPLRLGEFVQEVCHEVVDVFWETHHLDFSDSSDRAYILADPKQMRQLVINLLGNAFKYSESGSTVHVSVACGSSEVILNVSDSGIGIPVEARPHLFDIFYRAENVGMISGTGLGLAIVKLVVDQHQGTLEYESEVGAGTTFTIHLPIRQRKL